MSLLPETHKDDDTKSRCSSPRLLVAQNIEASLIAITANKERSRRFRAATIRRLLGTPIASDEIKGDLTEVVGCLLGYITHYNNNSSLLFKTAKHMLVYCERSAYYAINDYPRDFAQDADIRGLWDALDRIHVVAQAWRMGEHRGNDKAFIAYIEKTARNAMKRIYPAIGDDDTILEEV